MKSFLHVFTAALLLAFEVGAAPHAYHQEIERQEKGPIVTVTVTAGAEVTVPASVPDQNNPPPPPPPPPHHPDHDHDHDHQQHPHHNHHHPHPQPHPHPHPDKPDKPNRQFGISYSPYNTDSTCKTQEEVTHDVAGLSPNYAFIRIYGVDCNQTATVTTAARQHDMQVFAGIFDLSDFPNSLQPIIDVGNGNDVGDVGDGGGWETFHTIAIGNELINKNQNTIPEVSSALHTARAKLRAAGYQGPVVTVDVYSEFLEHPDLCDASDYCATNCHVFFDATQTAEKAGGYARDVARKISQKSGGKRTVVAESGWPHAGGANGEAVPSERNQRVAVESLRREFADAGEELGLVLFTAFDDLWKVDAQGTFGAEKFWGIQR